MTSIRAWFPKGFPKQQEEKPEEIFVENALQTMHFWKLTKREFDDLTIPEYFIMRDFASKKIQEEHQNMEAMMGKKKPRGKI